MAEIESRVAREIATQKPKADHSARIGELQREVENLTEAIASGLLKMTLRGQIDGRCRRFWSRLVRGVEDGSLMQREQVGQNVIYGFDFFPR
jgi:hypothetical protein